MVGFGEDERFWLELRWSSTSRAIVKVLAPLAYPVAEELLASGAIGDACWDEFVTAAARALNRLRLACRQDGGGADGGFGRSGMYATAISLFGDAAPMRDELTHAIERMRADPGAVTWACLRTGLYRMRMRAGADIENRARTWQRLRPFVAEVRDRGVVAAFGIDNPDRYSDDFCGQVAALVRSRHPTDKNLPASAEGVKRYLAQFDEGFTDPDETGEVDADDIATLPDLTRGLAYLDDCAALLGPPLAAVWDTVRREASVAAYCLQAGMPARRFYHLRDQAQAMLADCVRGRFARGQGS